MEFESIMLIVPIILGIVTALTELVKKAAPAMPKNMVPVVSFVLGFVVAWLFYPFTDLALAERMWAGGIAGLGATGLYETVFKSRPGETK